MELDLSIDNSNVEDSFEKISYELLNKWILEANKSQYRIAEIEFYLKSVQHNDTYTHGHELQKTSGNWYFHGSGIDLTFGTNNFYGGILLRAIYNITEDKYIHGPLKIVTELFSNLSTAYSSPFQFGLKPDSEHRLVTERVFKAPRVGLNPLKNGEVFNKYYRHFIMPKEEHKDKTIIYEALMAQGLTEEEAGIIWK